MIILLCLASPVARADCPAAPIGDPDDMAISFLKANGVQAASASLLASSVKEGTLVYDDTADKLKVCDGTNWIDVGSGSGSDTLASLSCTAGEIAKYNGTAWACAADGGGGSSIIGPAFSAHNNNVNLTVATNTPVPVVPSTKRYDTTNAYSTSTGRFTPTVAGKYLVVARAWCPDNSSWCQARIYKNGAHYSESGVGAGTGYVQPTNAAIVDMNGTTDYVQMYVYNGGGTTISGAPGNTSFEASLIGGGAADTLSGLSCATNEIPKWNGTAWACAADGGGSSGMTKGLYAAGTLNIGSSATTIDVATSRNDFGAGAWSSGVFTVPAGEAGWYVMTFYPSLTAAVGEGLSTGIRINGAGVTGNQGTTPTGAAYGNQHSVAHAAYLNAGDAVSFRAQKTVAASNVTVRASIVKINGGSDTLAGLSCSSGQIPKWNGSAWACAADGGGGSSGAIQSATQATDPLTLADGVTTDVVSLTASTTGTYTILANGYTNAAAPWAYLSSNCDLLVNGTVVHQQPFYYGAHDAAAGSSPFFPHTLNAVSAITAGQVVKVRCMSTSSSATRTANKWRIDLVPVGGGASLTGGTSGYLGVWSDATTMGLSGTATGQNLFWDGANHRLGIGTTTPTTTLDLSKIATGNTLFLRGGNAGNAGDGAEIQLSTAWGNTTTVGGASIAMSNVWGSESSGQSGDLVFKTNMRTGPNAYTGLTERMRISSAGNVGIGTASPATAAVLDLTSTTKGFLPPRMTTTQRDAISSPAVGLMIFDTTAAQYQFWNGTAWSGLGSGGVPTGTIAAFALATCPSGWTEYTAARGRFLRGIDPTGASVDPDGTRAPGNLQADAMQQITGSMGFNRTAASNLVGAFVGGGTPGASGATSGSNAAGSVAFNSANSPSARTSVETRPKNVAVLFCQYNGSGGGGGGSSQWTDVTGGINYAGGKVGIGTTAPAGPLHVVTTAAVPAITMERTGDANVFLEFESTTGLTGVDGGGSSGFLRFYTAGAQRMIVNSAGNIGIGTTTPQSLLQVAGGIQLADDAAACPGASNVKLGTLKYGSNVLSVCNTGGWTTLTAGGGTLSGGTSGYLGVWTGATTMGLSSTVAGQSLFWDATNHRLGIGTNNPQDVLDLGPGTNGRSIVWGGSTGTNHYASVGTTYSFGSLSLVRGLKLATAGADQYLYSYATGSRAGIRIGGGSASDISFFNEPAATQTVGDAFDYVANTKMTIKDSGNVGVGTTAPSSLLHVKKDQTAATTQILVENVGAADPATISALSVGEGGVAYGSLRRYRDGSGTVELANVQNAPLHLLTNNIRRLTILGTGNVGIGTTSPTAAGGIAGYDTPLYIANAGNPLLVVQSTANGAANLAGVALKTGISTNYWQMYAKNGKFTVGVASVGDFLTIDGTGNVGIGTTSPAQKLDVSGIVQVRTTSNGFLQLNPGSTTQNGYVGFFGAGGTRSGYVGWGNQGNVHLTADTGMVVLQAGASGWTATLDNAGSFSVPAAAYKPGGGAWAASSDARLKDIDGDYDQGLDSIIRLNPIRFHYKKDNARKEPSGKSFVGLIAQEVQKAFPEAVSEGRDGYLSLDTTPINFAVINAIKELKADNDNLRAELQAANENYKDQDAALENLRREIDALKAAR